MTVYYRAKERQGWINQSINKCMCGRMEPVCSNQFRQLDCLAEAFWSSFFYFTARERSFTKKRTTIRQRLINHSPPALCSPPTELSDWSYAPEENCKEQLRVAANRYFWYVNGDMRPAGQSLFLGGPRHPSHRRNRREAYPSVICFG
jgi:hypothetical protein